MHSAHANGRTLRLWKAGIAAAAGVAIFAHSGAALAASSWSPTLLVNTESFQVIDDGDGTTDLELRFGSSVNEKIFWDVETGRFQFTDDVHIEGNLTVTGSLITDGAISTKSNLTINSDNGGANATLTFGNDGGAETIEFNDTSNNFSVSDDVDVTGTVNTTGNVTTDADLTINEDNGNADAILTFGNDGGAETFRFNNTSNNFSFSDDIDVTGNVDASGNLSADGNLTVNEDAGAADAILTFGNDAGNETVRFSDTTNEFEFSDDVEIQGTASGRRIHAQDLLTSSGKLVVEGTASIHGTLSGNTIEGFNLSDCDSDTQSLQWDSTTKTFVCGDDDTGAGSLTQTDGDARYVNQSGDTMTGDLVIANGGALAASGSIRTEGDLTINQDNGGADAILTFGNDAGAESIRFNDTTNNFTFSDDIDVTGTVNTTGNITTDANLTINEDNGAADAVLTFGNDAGAETITFSDTTNRFEFSDDLKVTGNLSGSTLTVDGAVTIRGQTYNFPGNGGTSGSVLRTDGAGNLSWSTGVNEGSGGIISLQPEYAGASYFASGSSYIGQLAASGSTNTGSENTYEWNSTKASIQDYWISARVRVPDNFVRWDPVKSIQLRYRTGTSTTSENHITVKMRDTAGAAVALTGGATLANTSFTTANITGPASAGTFTPGGYFTVLIKMAASSAGQANAGHLTFHWETRTP